MTFGNHRFNQLGSSFPDCSGFKGQQVYLELYLSIVPLSCVKVYVVVL